MLFLWYPVFLIFLPWTKRYKTTSSVEHKDILKNTSMILSSSVKKKKKKKTEVEAKAIWSAGAVYQFSVVDWDPLFEVF